MESHAVFCETYGTGPMHAFQVGMGPVQEDIIFQLW